jgi:4-diphosphocytidyl-2-C-methyl-D-erythritol kinase
MHQELAHAKLTVSLKLVGLRSDGFHLVDAEMVSLDLADTLTFSEGSGLSIAMADSAAGGLNVEATDDNLVARALRAVGRQAHVAIIKRIPAGGGLGGGSSDAAAVYRWAGRTDPADVVAASKLGADVSFCINGGRARVTGIGEVLEPLPFVARTFTLCIPPFGVSTPAAYKAWDALGGPAGDGPNDLEAGAFVVEPRLAKYRDLLGNHSGIQPTLAGSGSTWFVEGAFDGEGMIVAHTVPAHNIPWSGSLPVRRKSATGKMPGGWLNTAWWTGETSRAEENYFFLARRWKRVLFNIFLCFFLRMRLRRFLINDPMVRRR